MLHDASFIDDPTRLLRLALYSSRLGFAIEPDTLELARVGDRWTGRLAPSAARGSGPSCAAWRASPIRSRALGELHELGIDAAIAPGYGLRRSRAGAARAGAAARRRGDRATLVLAAAGLELGAGELSALLTRLAFEAARRDAIVAAAARARPLAAALRARDDAVGDRRGGRMDASVEAVALAGALGAAERRARVAVAACGA